MMITMLRRLLPAGGRQLVPVPCLTKDMARDDIARLYARIFLTDDGRKVLDHLQSTTFMRSYGADTEDALLRFAEGQRSLVQQIMRMVEIGKK